MMHWPSALTGTSSIVAMLGCYGLCGLYRSRLSLSVLDDLPRLGAGVIAAFAWLAACTSPASDSDRVADLIGLAAVVLFAVVLFRALAYATVRSARRRGLVAHNVLVVGADDVGQRLMRELKSRRQYGLTPLGFVDNSLRGQKQGDLPVPLLGNLDQLAELVDVHAVCVVIVAFGACRERELVEVLRTCERARCKIFLVPRLLEVHPSGRDVDNVWGIPLISVRRAPYRAKSWGIKRLLDVLFSSFALVVLAPVLAACALAVRLETGPGVLFRQNRIGLDGRVFELLKFRSLMPASCEESDTMWNVAHDHRLGPVGRFLRRTSMDELPQLWNILVGQMSLVGPRPERPHFVERFGDSVPGYTARHRVPAGLTGWAQVHGLRGDTSIEDRAAFDNYYIQNWSLWGDLKIVVRTLQQVVQRCGG
jgi:exopolysaccharide biosynthesis polyprenyl glycosylphosphotransferase